MQVDKILLVDDEEDIRMVTMITLSKVGGFEVTSAASGALGLVSAKEHTPDLILLDVMMPGMDGMTTFDRLREQPETAHVPIIFMTAKVQAKEVDEYLSKGALGVIKKPFDPMALPDQIRALTDPL